METNQVYQIKIFEFSFQLQQEGSDNEGEETQADHEQDQEHDMTCHWKECQMQCESQDDLVKHVNSDHIKKDRKDFTCYWDGCTREKKPFKAQYMLVVHMRRHTGEKPHKCTVSFYPLVTYLPHNDVLEIIMKISDMLQNVAIL